MFNRLISAVCISIMLALLVQAKADIEVDNFYIEPLPNEMEGKDQKTLTPAAVDYVLVKKRERKLILYAGVNEVKSYTIALGKQPKGQKLKEGDSRTPEGIYTLDWRNPNSKFYRSIHVSYPSISQERSAKEAGIDPGGAIMIHGQPSDWSERIKLTFADKDWTEGCIALENQDMIEVWDLVKDGTPIEIQP